MPEFRIDKGALYGLPPDACQLLADKPLELLSASAGHLLLVDTQASAPVLLAGVLEEGAIPDLLSYFNMFRKSGVLNILLDGGSKALYFQQGEVVFATSTFAAEDIGSVLFSLGKIERQALEQLRQQVTATTTLGKLLVEQASVSPKDLWLAARSEVENIVYNLFSAARGAFYFQAKAAEQEDILRLSMSTQNMIMEGLRRLDEKALFMRKIISLDYYPKATGKEAGNLTETETRMLNLTSFGQLKARDLFRKSGVREFDGIRTLYGLVERNLLRMHESSGTEIEGVLGQILTIYNNLFRELHSPLKQVNPRFPEEIAQELRILPQPYSFVLRDVEFRADGTLEGHILVDNLDGLELRDKTKLLVDSLAEVAYLKSMAVRQKLSAEQARPLISRVQESTAQARVLAGRDK
jgi:hypothetical protein